MIAFAMVLALLFLFLLVKFPKPMFYGMCFITAAILIGIVIVSFVVGAYFVGIIALVILALYACVYFCSRDKIAEGIVLMQVACKFISQKPSIFLIPFFMMLFVVVF